jgi:hypothetical protein
MSKDMKNKVFDIIKYTVSTLIVVGLLGVLIFYVNSFNNNYRKYEFKLSSNVVNLFLGNDGNIPILMANGDDVDFNNYSFTVTDPSVVKVSKDGTITPLRAGNTVVVVKAKNSRQKELLNISVIMVGNTASIQDIKLNDSIINLKVGDIYNVNFEVIPSGSAVNKIIWTSSNIGVASIDNGVITAKSLGTCTINIKCGDISKEIIVNITNS